MVETSVKTKSKQKIISRKTVFVGLSGGVDSAVSAALLQQAGFFVVGVFIRIWSPEWQECTSKEDRLDAMRVAVALGIPFREIDLTDIYKKEVVDYMIREFKAGRTPNPDVLCNKTVKFGAFFDYAMSAGADFVATGHYAQVADANGMRALTDDAGSARTAPTSLCMAKDPTKDQTYFLSTITQAQLEKTLFPVGHLLKSQVRALAKKLKLPNALRKDSQGLCFVGKVDVKDFLKRSIPERLGEVLDRNGKVIGSHTGASLLTIGERHGFRVAPHIPTQDALYVIAKDTTANTITVDSHATTLPKNSILSIHKVHWIMVAPPNTTIALRYRHRGTLVACHVEASDKNNCSLVLHAAMPLVAPGQFVVLYKNEECLGGGVIDSGENV